MQKFYDGTGKRRRDSRAKERGAGQRSQGGTSRRGRAFQYPPDKQEQQMIHHKIFQKKYVYIQFIFHIPPSSSFVQGLHLPSSEPGQTLL